MSLTSIISKGIVIPHELQISINSFRKYWNWSNILSSIFELTRVTGTWTSCKWFGGGDYGGDGEGSLGVGVGVCVGGVIKDEMLEG